MKDLKHYLLLASLMSVGFGFFWYFNYDRPAQALITLLMGAAYILWGIVHHTLKKEFHLRLVLEYVVVAVVACVVVIFLLLRS